MILRGGFLLFLVVIGFSCFAQNDDLMKQDSIKIDTLKNGVLKRSDQLVPVDSVEITSDKPVKEIDSYAKRFNPHKASLYSMVFPGAGQIYVKRYWKVPLVWGGMGFMVYAVSFSATQYTHYKNELFQTINYPGIVLADGLDQERLRTIVNEARRQRDYFLIINFFMYVLQIVDAHVDAHLKEFKLNPNLQVRVESIPIQYSSMPNAGLTFAYKF
jgi:hypothetical protein